MGHSDSLLAPPTTLSTEVFLIILISALVRVVLNFIKVVRQRYLARDAILISITDMFVL